MEPSLPPILCFVGRSNSGKTTLIERVIPVLAREGYRIATIKHAGHGFDLDTEGKDSWRLKRAGAKTVLGTSRGSLAMCPYVAGGMQDPQARRDRARRGGAGGGRRSRGDPTHEGAQVLRDLPYHQALLR